MKHVLGMVPGAHFCKVPETFPARKAIFRPETLCEGNFCIMELNSSKIIRIEILLWLSMCENFHDLPETGPRKLCNAFGYGWFVVRNCCSQEKIS